MQGAVENVLERSTHIQLLDGSTQELDQYSRDLILQSLHDMSMSALRCLGFAYSDVPSDFATYDGSEDHPAHQQLLNPSNYSSIESNLTFVGFVGLRVSFSSFLFLLWSLIHALTFSMFFEGSSEERGASSHCRLQNSRYPSHGHNWRQQEHRGSNLP